MRIAALGKGDLRVERLSYEVLGSDAVVVVGTFRAQWLPEDPIQLASYTALLVREDGELRIRLEDESFDNVRSVTCGPDVEFCELALDRAAGARYLGLYQAGSDRVRRGVLQSEFRSCQIVFQGANVDFGGREYQGEPQEQREWVATRR